MLIEIPLRRPFARSKHGSTQIMVFFDRYTKWMELVPQRKATAEFNHKALKKRILDSFGVPKVLISGNGAQFISKSL